MAKRERALQDRLAEIEKELYTEKMGFVDKGDRLALLEETLKVREAEMSDLSEKNKDLTQECQILTVRMLEEKGKMIEMMNEANNIFDGAQR